MTKEFFDRAYSTTAQEAVVDLYNDWAATYDEDLVQSGYTTPKRCASALAAYLHDKAAPVLDFACGTGLSGAALAREGFTVIDGIDLSEGMLRSARKRDIYRRLVKADPNEAPRVEPGEYAAIAAVGALSPGAAPASYFETLVSRLAPGGLFVLSYNDHTLADADYTSRLERALTCGTVRERFREHGDHIVKLGSKSIVYVLEKLDAPA
ncbi:MAG: class I SAM-dependent DNA methyltransferase [Hyphomicrobiaceae bacterium]